ncbi:Gfo/Idh/MocA family oxidoreductase [Salinisphaera sp. USBA-960]|uniref:Gfo/Idh/MocA family protein n=1 Tax=Salinisphaera orenii TaxID=856731 RepID=UPI000DBE4389|nr:Gfo/Idh/MocA family oxidoreductase [Salifodinibacter halophilus]NNC25660.1 Gfo/Idh/MocA family oxidoreductase [Salifodinibacter halophilus]
MTRSSINWGVLGAAEIAREHTIPAIVAAGNSRPYALASRRGVPAEVMERFGFETGYGDYDALLADPAIDAVYLPLPNDCHAEWTIKAARAGKHVLCEKPAALTATQTAEAIAACQSAEVLYMEAMMYQFHAQHARVRELIAAGAIGAVRGVHVNLTFNLEKSLSDFRHGALDAGGGSLYDLGCYCIHTIRSLLGEPDRTATMARFAGPQNAEMSAAVVFGYDNGIKAGFDCGMDATGRHAYEVYGAAGTIRVTKAFVPQADGDGPIEIVDAEGNSTTERVVSFQYMNGITHFADCVLHSRTPNYSPENVRANMRVLDACIESATTSRIVQLENR